MKGYNNMSEVLTIADALRIGDLMNIVTQNRRVQWAIDGDVERLCDGVARHIVKSPDNFGFLGRSDDVRDGFVRISGTMEHALPVRQVLELMKEGLFVPA